MLTVRPVVGDAMVRSEPDLLAGDHVRIMQRAGTTTFTTTLGYVRLVEA